MGWPQVLPLRGTCFSRLFTWAAGGPGRSESSSISALVSVSSLLLHHFSTPACVIPSGTWKALPGPFTQDASPQCLLPLLPAFVTKQPLYLAAFLYFSSWVCFFLMFLINEIYGVTILQAKWKFPPPTQHHIWKGDNSPNCNSQNVCIWPWLP